MGLFEKIKTKYNEHVQARKDACSNLIADINLAIHEKATILSSQESFIDVNVADQWIIKYSDLKNNFQSVKKLRRADDYSILLTAGIK